MKEIGIYIHIPFCEEKCFYCNFVSFCKNEKEQEKYIRYLLKEIDMYDLNSYLVTSIFIGGGTPTIISGQLIGKVLKKIRDRFNISPNAEITIEANPNSFTYSKAKIYKDLGVNRISFGLQSANDKILKIINRKHSKKDFINAIKIAKNLGLENINVDILVGLPSQKLADVKKTIKLLLREKIPHISCYSLILEEGTVLNTLIKEAKLSLPSEDDTLKMYEYVLKKLEKNKIYRYEVSNFAKKGFECKHNLKYWSNIDYLGLGLNSHSKISNKRFCNQTELNKYYERIRDNKKPILEENILTNDEKREEFIFLSLRKSEGLSLDEYFSLFGERLEKEKAREIDFLLRKNLIEIVGDNLFATRQGFNVLNEIIIRLI